eukprot:SAG31_NODE_1783_length_7280_cov_105.645314_1_plen_31_part_10
MRQLCTHVILLLESINLKNSYLSELYYLEVP